MRDWLLVAIISVFAGLGGWQIGIRRTTLIDEPPAPIPSEALAALALTAPAETINSGTMSELLDQVMASASQSGSSSELAVQLFEAIQHLADADLPSVVALAQGGQFKPIGYLLVGYWAERDLEAAKKWMLSLPPSTQIAVAEDISATWCRANPAEFLTWLEGLPDDARRTIIDRSSYSIVKGVAISDYARVVQLLISNSPQQQSTYAIGSLFNLWARSAPSAAAQKALSLAEGGARTEAVLEVAYAWAQQDANASAAWVRGLGDAVLTGRATAAYAKGLALKNPRAAAEFVGNLVATEENNQALNVIARQWGATDPKPALTWADAIQDEEGRSHVLQAMLSAIAANNPVQAAQAYAERCQENSLGFGFDSPLYDIAQSLFQTNGIDAVVRFSESVSEFGGSIVISHAVNTWASDDPAAATAWVLKQPDEARGDALSQVAIYAANRAKPFEWAYSLPKVPSSDGARYYIASSLLSREDEDRPKAMELISQFTDTGKARANLRRLAARWLRMDAASARSWIESPNLLTPEDKAWLSQKGQ